MPPYLESRVRALPCWRGVITVEPLAGGLGNANFKVVSQGRVYVARIGDDVPAHHIVRRREADVSRWAHAAGLSPAVLYSGDGALVRDDIAGPAYTAADVRADLDRVADLIARCHRDMAGRARGAATMFWVFQILRDYAHTLRERGHGGAADLSGWMRLVDELEAAQAPLPIVFGHHGLVPANFIADAERLWLVDWEYAAFGTAMFDLAHVAVHAGLDAVGERRLLDICLKTVDGDVRRSFAAMKVAAAMRDMLWAMVTELDLKAPSVDDARQRRATFEAEASVWTAHAAG